MVDASIKHYVNAVKENRSIKARILAFLPIFALLVAIAVFWWLKLTGITMTADAFCGIPEHTHTEACSADGSVCETEEHIHDSSCYSDLTADIETIDDWEASISGVSSELSQTDRLVQIAISQLEYSESTRNFTLDDTMTRRGYTRYGEWFGNPYGEWSSMFTAFCLRYAGFDTVPISAGAETMRLAWESEGMYKVEGEHTPLSGDIVFLDKNGNGQADATAIVTELFDGRLYVIEGDLEDAVHDFSYAALGDAAVMGYGVVSPSRGPVMMAVNGVGTYKIGNAVNYNQSYLDGNGYVLLYTQGYDGNYYAIDGDGNAVKVYVDANGSVTCDTNSRSLLWSFTYYGTYERQRAYHVQNVETGKYLHPHADDHTREMLSVLTGKWETAVYISGNGIKLRGARQDAYSMLDGTSRFTAANNLNGGSVLNLAIPPEDFDVWFDGTCGGIMAFSGSADVHYYVTDGTALMLPQQWQSPAKYSYTLRGWYDIVNGKYYAPGATVTITGDTVFYADWSASTYDIGQFNAQVSNTVSTNDFVTVRVFDYGPLFNLYSESVSTTISASSHSETWSLITSGEVPHIGKRTLDYIFRDWDRGNEDISYPKNHNDKNNPTSAGSVYSGLYTEVLGDMLFNPETSYNPATGEGILGKEFVGYGDHLFKYMNDPSSEYHGYYYYDSAWNAASYNQTDGRFYVYDYLERSSDSSSAADSDFLPFNSPYTNTNGKNVVTYTYDGDNGEYRGTTHYVYDGRYDTNGSSTSNVGTNFWFGMSVEVEFYLPNAPGTLIDGEYGNRDVFGKDMHFRFAGDDDVWIFVDDELVLDLGGIHGIESGDINFATGIVTINGNQDSTIYDIEAGEHKLTVLYLERGASLSHCGLYFNLAPRYSLSLQKEDVLTRELLNGAQFSVFTDEACTIPAELWNSQAEHDNGVPSTNVFTTVDGTANIWGFGSGNTYYIKETRPPDNEDYSVAYGTIRLKIDKQGDINYTVSINGDGTHGVSNGFTIHGFRIDEETQKAYIVVTNAKSYVTETTSVSVRKVWGDWKDHSSETVTAYLAVKYPDGSVARIREVHLGADNSWSYTWDNIPKYYEDGVTEIEYIVDEAHVPGYTAKIERAADGTYNYTITNEVLPSSNETSLTVYKIWDTGSAAGVDYERFTVTIRLLANGVDSGRTVALNLKNGWKDTFRGLPYKDDNGNVIEYTVVEVGYHDEWLPVYGEVISKGGSPPTYEVNITNVYFSGINHVLPSTGGYGQTPWVLSGFAIMVFSLVSVYMTRRKRERRKR